MRPPIPPPPTCTSRPPPQYPPPPSPPSTPSTPPTSLSPASRPREPARQTPRPPRTPAPSAVVFSYSSQRSSRSPVSQRPAVFIMSAHPEGSAPALIPALRRQIQVVIVDVQLVVSPVVARIAVKNRAALILVEHAVPFALGSLRILYLEVVESVFLCKLFRRERHVIVKIEIRIARGDPLEIPAHPLLVVCQLGVRRTRDGDHRHVALLEVRADAVESVGPQRAVRAACCSARLKHEVIDNQLASSLKKFRQGLFSIRSLEDILFPDRLPRQRAPLLIEVVLQPRELFFLRQKRHARRKPLLVRYHSMILDYAAAVVFHALTSSRNANHATVHGVEDVK